MPPKATSKTGIVTTLRPFCKAAVMPVMPPQLFFGTDMGNFRQDEIENKGRGLSTEFAELTCRQRRGSPGRGRSEGEGQAAAALRDVGDSAAGAFDKAGRTAQGRGPGPTWAAAGSSTRSRLDALRHGPKSNGLHPGRAPPGAPAPTCGAGHGASGRAGPTAWRRCPRAPFPF